MVGMTKGKFGFLRGGGEHEPSPVAAYVQIYVRSRALAAQLGAEIGFELKPAVPGFLEHAAGRRV
jgi:hypothetical protein